MPKILVVAGTSTAEQLGQVLKGLSDKISDPKLNARLDEAVAGMSTYKETIVYAKGGDVYLGRHQVKDLSAWKKYGKEHNYKYLYKGFTYHGNERAQVAVFDDKVWDAQELQRRKGNGLLGIHFYDLTTGAEKQVTEGSVDVTKVNVANIGKRVTIAKTRFSDNPNHQAMIGKSGVIEKVISGRNVYQLRLDGGKIWDAIPENVIIVEAMVGKVDHDMDAWMKRYRADRERKANPQNLKDVEDALSDIERALSPENLSNDGELSHFETERKRNRLTKEKRKLEQLKKRFQVMAGGMTEDNRLLNKDAWFLYSELESKAQQDGEPMFWSNKDGWGSFETATGFPKSEISRPSALAATPDAKWIDFKEAHRLWYSFHQVTEDKKYDGRTDKDKLYIIKISRPINSVAGYSGGLFDEIQVVSPKTFSSGYFPRHQVVGEYVPKDSDIFTWSYTSSERFKGTELFDRVKEGSGRWLMVTGNPLFKKIDKANPANVTEAKDDFYDEGGKDKYFHLGVSERMPIHYEKAKQFFTTGDKFNAGQHARAYLAFVPEGHGELSKVPEMKKIRDASMVTESEVSDVVMGKRISYTPIFLHKDAESLKEKIKEGLSAPWKQVQYSALGGDERGSFLIAVSLDKKENWQNGYLENSRYARFHLNNTGELEHFSGSGMGKFRKSRVKDVDAAIAKINSFIEQQSKPMSESTEINVGDIVKVDMGVVTKHDNLPHYLSLVRAAVKDGGGKAEVVSIKDGSAQIAGGTRDKFLGGPWVPLESLRRTEAILAGGGESFGSGGFAT